MSRFFRPRLWPAGRRPLAVAASRRSPAMLVMPALLLAVALAGCTVLASSNTSTQLQPLQPGQWPTTTSVPPSPTASPFPQVNWTPTPVAAEQVASTPGQGQDAPGTATAVPVVSAAPAFMGLPGKVAASANLRAGPGTGYAVVAVLYQGDTLTVMATDQAQDWLLVKASGKEGWLSRDLVTVSGNASALPQATPAAQAG